MSKRPDVLEARRAHEVWNVKEWRYQAALQAGLSPVDAAEFATSLADIGVLRELARAGVAPDLIVRILR